MSGFLGSRKAQNQPMTNDEIRKETSIDEISQNRPIFDPLPPTWFRIP